MFIDLLISRKGKRIMAKKYVPSGYQIIDLGSLDLSSNVTINKGENADADVLISLVSEGKLGKKPILLSLYDEDEDVQLSGFGIIVGENVELNIAALSARYYLAIDSAKIVISK